MAKIISPSLFSVGSVLNEETRTSTIGGKKVTEREGKLAKDLGKPAMKATEGELNAYIDSASSAAEKKKRVARVNLMKAHKKGLKAKGSKVPTPQKGKAKKESMERTAPVLESIQRPAVVKPKYR